MNLIPTPADPVATVVFFLIVFTVVGAFFLFIHLVMGSFLRPNIPDAEKLTIYECGEPTVGSAWVQFDLRYYVVALLFVIFDVEVAFFFPWATVFGKANQLANADLSSEQRQQISAELLPSGLTQSAKESLRVARYETKTDDKGRILTTEHAIEIKPAEASSWAFIVFWDIAIFFGVLMVGFAYVWRRGDINWVRSYSHHDEPPVEPEHPLEQSKAPA